MVLVPEYRARQRETHLEEKISQWHRHSLINQNRWYYHKETAHTSEGVPLEHSSLTSEVSSRVYQSRVYYYKGWPASARD
jgi:hypothetical protein